MMSAHELLATRPGLRRPDPASDPTQGPARRQGQDRSILVGSAHVSLGSCVAVCGSSSSNHRVSVCDATRSDPRSVSQSNGNPSALLVLPPSARPRLVALQMVSHARQRIVACHVHGTV